MRLIFVSDHLSLDEDFAPLTELLDLTDVSKLTKDGVIPVSMHSNSTALQFARGQSAHVMEVALARTNKTYYLKMPEGALNKWLETDDTAASPKERVKALLAVDYPGWEKLNPLIPESLMFFLYSIRVVTRKNVFTILSRT